MPDPSAFLHDCASLRRYFVDEGLLTRADGAHPRTGGRDSPGHPDSAP